MPKLGERLYLDLQLWDGATDQHPVAYLYDGNGAELPMNPVILNHVSRGFYSDDTRRMPSTPLVRAVFKVYTDAAHTIMSDKYSDAIDAFELEKPEVTPVLIGMIDSKDITGIVHLSGALGGLIISGGLHGFIDEKDTGLGGIVEVESELGTGVNEHDDVEGIVTTTSEWP